MFLAAEVLIEGETVLLAPGALIEEVKVIPGPGMLDGVAAATDGDIFDRLVVVFLKCMFWYIKATRLGAL